MLEAVNSVLSNAAYTKAIADQQSVANSFAANPARVQQASLQAPYISLYIKVDVNFDKALLLQRDRDTGDVVRQIPSEAQLEAYKRSQAVVAPKISYEDTEVETTTAPAYEPRVAETTAPEVSTPEVSAPAVTAAPATTSAPVSIDTQA